MVSPVFGFYQQVLHWWHFMVSAVFDLLHWLGGSEDMEEVRWTFWLDDMHEITKQLLLSSQAIMRTENL